MSNDDPHNAGGMGDLGRMWMEYMANMAKGAAGMPPMTPPSGVTPDALREMRAAMLKSVSDYLDQFMRTQPFLDWMQKTMASSVDLRKQMNDFFAWLQNEWQGASRQDIDRLAAENRRMNSGINEGFERVEELLGDINKRLADLEKHLGEKRSSEPRKRRK